MIEFLLTLPSWALSLGAGLILAIAGALLVRALKLEGPWLRYLPLVLVAIGYAATDRFALPALMQSDLGHCAIARATADETNRQRAGSKPDPLTTFVATTADCTGKTLSTRYAADAPRASLDPAGLSNVELMFTAETCGAPLLRRMIESGWRVENVYEFTSGEPLVMAAKC